MAERCSHKFDVGGACERCGDTFPAVQVRDLQGLVERYGRVATRAVETAHGFEKALDAKHAQLVEVADLLRALRDVVEADREAIREAANLLRAAPLRRDVEDLTSSSARRQYLAAVDAWLKAHAPEHEPTIKGGSNG